MNKKTSSVDSGNPPPLQETVDAVSRQRSNSRWKLCSDVLAFQGKLFVDGLRDLILSPISIAAAIAGLLLERDEPRKYFDRVLHFGIRSEIWINLFGRFRRKQELSIDELVARLEDRVSEHYNRGGTTQRITQQIDRTLDQLHNQMDRLKAKANADPKAAPTADSNADNDDSRPS